MSLLNYNGRLLYCAYAVRKFQKGDYFITTASLLASTADDEELKKTLHDVAKNADKLENHLTEGKDEE